MPTLSPKTEVAVKKWGPTELSMWRANENTYMIGRCSANIVDSDNKHFVFRVQLEISHIDVVKLSLIQ